jgi:hypothetical protein
METVRKKLTVGKEKQGLDLYCSLKIDGEEKRRFRSRSFLGSFGSLLQSRMHGGGDYKLGMTDRRSITESQEQFIFDSQRDIEAYQQTNPAVIQWDITSQFNGYSDYDSEKPGYIVIVNAGDYNGVYYYKRLTDQSAELYDFDGNPIDATGWAIPSTTGYAMVDIGWNQAPAHSRNYLSFYQNAIVGQWDIMIGRSNKPVDVRDIYLHDRIMPGSGDQEANHGNRTINPLITDKPTSKFVISKPFTNQGSTTLEVKELGIYSTLYYSTDLLYHGFLQVRDTLESPLSVPAGKTLTVDYEVVVRVTPDTLDTSVDGTNGGFLAKFMELIREISLSSSSSEEELQLATLPGTSFIGLEQQGDDGFPSDTTPLGIKLGTSNKYVSMTDQTLDPDNNGAGNILHGEADGQLYHYGTDITPLKYDTVNNKATFTIERIFENRGSVAVAAKELGLVAISTHIDPNDAIERNRALIARTALDSTDEITFSPGEYKKVIYEVEVIA